MTLLVPKLRFPEYENFWDRKSLKEVAIIGRGKSKHRPRNAKFLYGGNYPFIQTGDIRNADLYLTEFTQTYSEAGLKQSKLWNEDTLCITIAANIAETAILKIKACFPDSIIGLIPKENVANVFFIKYQFDKFKLDIQNLSQGIAQANLNQEKLSDIEFSFPSLDEQKKIADFLTSVDTKLQQLTKKKNLLEQYKKGVIQKIFNQEIRFKDEKGKDFPKWEERKLEDVFNCVKGIGLSRELLNSEGINKCVLYGELYTKYKENIFEVESKTNSNDGVRSKIGDLLMPGSTTTTGIDLVNATVLNEADVLIGGDVSILRLIGNGNPLFYAYYLTHHKKKELAKFAQGITIVHLSFNNFKELIIMVPTENEQTKIANFLSAIDRKIEHTNKIIEKTKLWKKGLLQQLFV